MVIVGCSACRTAVTQCPCCESPRRWASPTRQRSMPSLLRIRTWPRPPGSRSHLHSSLTPRQAPLRPQAGSRRSTSLLTFLSLAGLEAQTQNGKTHILKCSLESQNQNCKPQTYKHTHCRIVSTDAGCRHLGRRADGGGRRALGCLDSGAAARQHDAVGGR